LSGNIRFIFQHAEELTPGGAIDFVKAGKLDNIKTVFGLHADAALKVNTVGILPGWISAQSIRIQIELEGSGGHSARPYEAFDPVYAGTIMLNELYSGLYRKQKAELPFVFSIGKINAGNAFNAIATSYIAEGTLRVTDTEQGDKLVEYIEKTVASIADKWGGTAKVNSIKGAPPVINDPEATRKVRNLIKDVLRDEQIITPQKSMGGEDFSMFLSKAPGVFLKIGISNDTINAPVHTGRFDIDEKAISFAVNLYAWILMRFFN